MFEVEYVGGISLLKRLFCLLVVVLLYGQTALGDTHPTLEAADLEFGEYLSSSCTSCHLISGEESNIPSIVGWDMEGFIHVLEAYRNKELENEVMQNIALSLDDEEILALAAYFFTIGRDEETE